MEGGKGGGERAAEEEQEKTVIEEFEVGQRHNEKERFAAY